MITSKELLASAIDLLDHPARTQRLMGNLITQLSGGNAIIYHAGNTVSNVLEAAATITSAAIDEARTLDRKRYASAALTNDDVLRHVADEDVIGIYSTPSRGTFRFVFEMNALMAAARPESKDGEVKKIILPRHTVVNNGVHEFTFQYPLIIRIYPNSGILCTWDIRTTSPIEQVRDSLIPHNIAHDQNNGTRYLTFDVDLPQLRLISRTDNVNSTTGFLKTYEIPSGELFHYCRAFILNDGDGGWSEIDTVYNNGVHDPSKPTVKIRVLENGVEARVPLTYLVNGLINNSIRIDIYTTSGAQDYLMAGFNENAFQVTWNDFDVNVAESSFVAALNRINGRSIFGIGSVHGGSNGVTTVQLRDQFIRRAQYAQGFAITRDQIVNSIGEYGLVNGIDNLTDRQYLATRQLPYFIEGYGLDKETMKTATGLGMTIGLTIFNYAKLSTSKYITDHGNRMTIHPKCLFKRIDGKLHLVSDAEIKRLTDRNLTSLEELVGLVNQSEYLYTPFHHRIDTSGNRMQVDAYHLIDPTITSKYAVQFNIDSKVAVSTREYAIGYREDGKGYTLALTVVPDRILEVLGADNFNIQLSFIGDQGGPRNFVTGTLMNEVDSDGKPVGEQWIYHFHIESTMDIDRNHRLIVHEDDIAINLVKEFDIALVVRNYIPKDVNHSMMSEYYDQRQFVNYDPSDAHMAVTHEKINIKFGDSLSHLWTRYRSLPEETVYEVHKVDVYKVWETDQYVLDDLGLPKLTWDSVTGTYKRTIKYHAGEIIKGSDGLPEILYAAGSIVKDEYGLPVPVDGARGTLRQLELLMVDGRYYFSNDDVSIAYRDAAVSHLSRWIMEDIPEMEKRILNAERSKLLFYPTDTMGKVNVTVDGGEQVDVSTTQYVGVDVFMNDDMFSNTELKDEITMNVPSVVNSALNRTTVSIQDIEDAIRAAIGASVISVRVDGLFDNRYNTVTINDHTGAFSLDKRLEIQTNLSLAVVDNIDIRFHRHAKAI